MVHLILVLCLVVTTIVFNPYDAFADPPDEANPSGVAGYPEDIPDAVYTNAGCDGPEECPYVKWWRCAPANETQSVRTCLHADSTQRAAERTTLSGPTRTRMIFSGAGQATMWNGTAWEATPISQAVVAVDGHCSSETIATNYDIYTGNFGPYNFVDYCLSSTFPSNTLVQAQNFEPVIRSIELTSSTGTGAEVGENVIFTVNWTNFGTGETLDIYFFPTGRGTGSLLPGESAPDDRIHIADDLEISETGSGRLSFTHTYNFGGSFTGVIIASTDCAEFGLNTDYENCDLERDELVMVIGGEADPDETYDVMLDFPVHYGESGANRLVNEDQPFEWRIDADICDVSTVSGIRLFKGYPPSISASDDGMVLAGTSGSGNLVYEYKSTTYNSWFTPYIKVYCSDGTSAIIYNGSTFSKPRATSLYIVDEEWSKYWVASWANGGQSTDYTPNGSGALFFVDKEVYERYEPVLMKFEYNVNFTVGSVAIYPDPDQLDHLFVITTGDILQENKSHNYSIEYEEEGVYFPKIQVRSSSYNAGNPATYRDIWLGGETYKNQSKYVTVTSGRYSTSDFVTDDGIFGLDPSTFTVSFGNSGNTFIGWAESIVNAAVRAALWVASVIFDLIKHAPFYSFFMEIVNPEEGVTKVLPSTLFGITMPDVGSREFTIQYAEEGDFGPIKQLLTAIFIFGMIGYMFNKFFDAR